MDANRFQRLKTLLVGALGRPSVERQTYLQQHSPNDEGLLREALDLLDHDIDEECSGDDSGPDVAGPGLDGP